ncbi:hypothetical protein EDB86DRAFT_1006473 [Lactarius hatsudake]|nr:hypothetical protein EDB86DRAFT_1006473 [Lactarius hatsudake]
MHDGRRRQVILIWLAAEWQELSADARTIVGLFEDGWTQRARLGAQTKHTPLTPIIRRFSYKRLLQDMDHRQTMSSSPRSDPSSAGSTAPRPSGTSTQITGSQGSRSQPLSVEVTVLRARNVPQLRTTFGGKREYFVTITFGAITKKTKKQNKKRTKCAQIDGQTLTWDQGLDAL